MEDLINVIPQTPRTKIGGMPIWFHQHGIKISLISCDPEQKNLKLGSGATIIEISFDGITYNAWIVTISIVHPGSEYSRIRRTMETQELKLAFGLVGENDEDIVQGGGQGLIKEYGGESARPGLFIRWKKYLNIPCPGTGYDGDPNTSIYLDEGIQQAVRNVIGEK